MADGGNYTNVILEEVRDQSKMIFGFVREIPEMKSDISQLKDDMTEVKADVKIIKSVVRDHSADIAELKAKTAHL